MTVTMTASAAERVKSFLAEQSQAVGLRFGVTKTGCSGYAYVVDLTDHVGQDDTVFDCDGVKVIVDASSLPFVDGTEIDFGGDGFGQSFKFHNPNVKSECGCGESFGI